MCRAGSAARLAEYAEIYGSLTSATPCLEGQGFPLTNAGKKGPSDDAQN